jgi:hypothetical protein
MSNWQRAPTLSGEALFNAALCWLRLDRAQEFAADYRKISNDPATQAVQANCSSKRARRRLPRET